MFVLRQPLVSSSRPMYSGQLLVWSQVSGPRTLNGSIQVAGGVIRYWYQMSGWSPSDMLRVPIQAIRVMLMDIWRSHPSLWKLQILFEVPTPRGLLWSEGGKGMFGPIGISSPAGELTGSLLPTSIDWPACVSGSTHWWPEGQPHYWRLTNYVACLSFHNSTEFRGPFLLLFCPSTEQYSHRGPVLSPTYLCTWINLHRWGSTNT